MPILPLHLPRCVTLVCAVTAGACMPAPGVVRVVDGEATEGPYISDQAYGAYVRGALLEANRDYAQAAAAYRQALNLDPDSPMLWVRLAAVTCQLDQPADAELDMAQQLDPEFAPLWHESARCAIRKGQWTQARSMAEQALRLDPEDEATTLLLASIEDTLERPGQSQRLLLAQVTRLPRSTRTWRALQKHARRAGDRAIEALARDELARLESTGRVEDAVLGSAGSPPSSLHRELLSANLSRARQAAVLGRLPPAAVALRALELGLPKMASAQAEYVLGADPSNSDAWIAALVAADRLADADAYQRLLASPPPSPTRPSQQAAKALADLVERRVGTEARVRFWDAWGLDSKRQER